METTGSGHSPLSQSGQCPELFVDGFLWPWEPGVPEEQQEPGTTEGSGIFWISLCILILSSSLSAGKIGSSGVGQNQRQPKGVRVVLGEGAEIPLLV